MIAADRYDLASVPWLALTGTPVWWTGDLSVVIVRAGEGHIVNNAIHAAWNGRCGGSLLALETLTFHCGRILGSMVRLGLCPSRTCLP